MATKRGGTEPTMNRKDKSQKVKFSFYSISFLLAQPLLAQALWILHALVFQQIGMNPNRDFVIQSFVHLLNF